MNGIFVVIEGIDGSGKSTQINKVKLLLEKEGYKIHITDEPTSQPIGDLCRENLVNPNSSPYVDALLFAADRIDHYQNEILPKLEKGFIVLSNRYKLSSLVYQGSNGVPIEWIKSINKYAPDPEIYIYLDIEVDIGLNRINNENRVVIEKFEKKEDLYKISTLYKQFVKEGMMISIDGDQKEETITKEIRNIIISKLKSSNKQ